MAAEGKLYVAKQSAVTVIDGRRVHVLGGQTVVREGHPLQMRYPHLFRELTVHFEVEQATAAPGETRKVAPAPKQVKVNKPKADADE